MKKGLHRPRLSAIIPIITAAGSHPDCRAVLIQIVALYLSRRMEALRGKAVAIQIDWLKDCKTSF